MFDAIVFAGGGNRCYWQGGFYEAVAERLGLKPALAVGASAGAFAGVYSLLGIGPQVRAQVLPACGPHRKNFDFSAWRRGEPLCPIGPMYRTYLDTLFDAALATDKETGLHDTLLAGTGVAGSLMGPWQTLITVDVGLPVAGPDHGFVLYLVFLKLFG